MKIDDLHKLIVEERRERNDWVERLLGLVEKSAQETACANEINRDLKDELKKVKGMTTFEFISKVFNMVVIAAVIILLFVAVRNDVPVKYGDFEVNMPNASTTLQAGV